MEDSRFDDTILPEIYSHSEVQMIAVVERFLRYVKIDTQSAGNTESVPSTAKQLDLARLLERELIELGLKEVSLDKHGYVMGFLPSNLDRPAPAFGLLAHMDTAPDMSGANVNPQFVENYDGGDIILNKEKKIICSPVDFPELRKYVGQTLITTDGTTLLGADDKAGIAEIMAMLEILQAKPEIRHGKICVGFTPDEEVGHGVDFFDVSKFGAEFAYTVDGGEAGEIQYETFNAASAHITIQGRNIHPGDAKNKMVNASLLAMELAALLPAHERPEHTERYEGFFHLTRLNGSVENAELYYIIREHDRAKFGERKAQMQSAVDFLSRRYPGRITLIMKDSYYNLREKVEPVMHIVDTAIEAIREAGLTPLVRPVRGGTDGSRLSFMGLPTPNLFTGGHYAHGRYELIPVQAMEKAVEVLLKLAELHAR